MSSFTIKEMTEKGTYLESLNNMLGFMQEEIQAILDSNETGLKDSQEDLLKLEKIIDAIKWHTRASEIRKWIKEQELDKKIVKIMFSNREDKKRTLDSIKKEYDGMTVNELKKLLDTLKQDNQQRVNELPSEIQKDKEKVDNNKKRKKYLQSMDDSGDKIFVISAPGSKEINTILKSIKSELDKRTENSQEENEKSMLLDLSEQIDSTMQKIQDFEHHELRLTTSQLALLYTMPSANKMFESLPGITAFAGEIREKLKAKQEILQLQKKQLNTIIQRMSEDRNVGTGEMDLQVDITMANLENIQMELESITESIKRISEIKPPIPSDHLLHQKKKPKENHLVTFEYEMQQKEARKRKSIQSQIESNEDGSSKKKTKK